MKNFTLSDYDTVLQEKSDIFCNFALRVNAMELILYLLLVEDRRI